MVEERLLGDRLQNVVVPLPATDASRNASSVQVFLGNQTDAGTPLDQVNELLQKANNIEKGLVATSNLQLKWIPKMHTQPPIQPPVQPSLHPLPPFANLKSSSLQLQSQLSECWSRSGRGLQEAGRFL